MLTQAGIDRHDDLVVLYESISADGPSLAVGRPIPDLEPASDLVVFDLPAGPVAATMVSGPYNQLAGVPGIIQAWCTENGQVPLGPSWEIYHHLPPEGEIGATTTVQWPVTPAQPSS